MPDKKAYYAWCEHCGYCVVWVKRCERSCHIPGLHRRKLHNASVFGHAGQIEALFVYVLSYSLVGGHEGTPNYRGGILPSEPLIRVLIRKPLQSVVSLPVVLGLKADVHRVRKRKVSSVQFASLEMHHSATPITFCGR